MTSRQVQDLLDSVFEEQALIIGGLVELHPVEDELVERLFRSLSVVRSKARRQVEGQAAQRPLHTPHPAIKAFLMGLRPERSRPNRRPEWT